MNPLTRRHFLTTTAAALAASACSSRLFAEVQATAAATPLPPLPRFPVGVCDWMILKRQKLGAFKLTSEIGADGVELDMGGLGDRPTFDNKLVDPAAREQFLAEAATYNLRICSMA